MKAYKGFSKDMTCLGYKYEEGKEYEHEGEVKVCSRGFHACERPLDCFDYYPPAISVYHVVELEGDLSMSEGDTKVAARKIKIGEPLDVAGLVSAQFDYVKKHTTSEMTDRDAANAGSHGAARAGSHGAACAGSHGAARAGSQGAARAGSQGAAYAGSHGAACADIYGAAGAGDFGAACASHGGAACVGEYGAACAGSHGAACAGDFGAACAGTYGAACAGDCGAACAGDYGAARAGSHGAARAGDSGVAYAGDYGVAISRGSSSVGEGGVAIARGVERTKVKGGVGAVLVIAVEEEYLPDIIMWKVTTVDGEKIKADTWYCLKDGEFEECE